MLPIFLGVAIIVILAVWAFYKVPAINKLFRDSETLAIQIVKTLAGAVGTLLMAADPSQVQDATRAVVDYLQLSWSWPIWLLLLSLAMWAVNRFRQKKA